MRAIKTIIILLVFLPGLAHPASMRDSTDKIVTARNPDGTLAVWRDAEDNILTGQISSWGDFPWDAAYSAMDIGETDCSGDTCEDGEDVTTWTDLKENYELVVFSPNSFAPNYDSDACPNGTPAIHFDQASSEALANGSVSCGGPGRRCTVIIIGRWHQIPGNYINIFAGVFDDERTKIYTYDTYYRYYAGGTGVGALNEGPQTKPPNETVYLDTDFHTIIWDLNGTNNGLFTPFTVDDIYEPAGVDIYGNGAGANVPLSGITLAANRFGNGQWANYEYCAVGLYTGDATADADWEALQQFVCQTWGLDLGEDSCP